MDRVACALQRDGLQPGDAVAICSRSSVRYVVVFLGALRAGAAVVPLPPSVTPLTFQTMMADAEARWLFFDDAAEPLVRKAGVARLIDLAVGPTGQGTPEAPVVPVQPFLSWAGEGGRRRNGRGAGLRAEA